MPDPSDFENFVLRSAADFLFFLLVIITLLNIIFGIIIDTFSELRTAKEDLEKLKDNTCFICGLERKQLERESKCGYNHHWQEDHNVWNYVGFVVYLKGRSPSDLSGLEKYVSDKINNDDTSWFPHGMAMCLVDPEEAVVEETETMSQVRSLSNQVRGMASAVDSFREDLVKTHSDIHDLKCSLREIMLHLGVRPSHLKELDFGEVKEESAKPPPLRGRLRRSSSVHPRRSGRSAGALAGLLTPGAAASNTRKPFPPAGEDGGAGRVSVAGQKRTATDAVASRKMSNTMLVSKDVDRLVSDLHILEEDE